MAEESSRPAATGRAEVGLELLKAPFSENHRYLICLAVPWKTPLVRLIFIWPGLEPPRCEQSFFSSGGFCQKQWAEFFNIVAAWSNSYSYWDNCLGKQANQKT